MKCVTGKIAKYIKLGPQGRWEDMCLSNGTLRLGFYEVPHETALQRNKKVIAQLYNDLGHSKGKCTDFARQVIDFYSEEDVVWVTFSNGYLWWCKAEPTIEYLGGDPESYPNGSRLRQTIGGWCNTDILGTPLRVTGLSGKLTKVQAYRSTICDISCLDYLLRKLNGQNLPEVELALKHRADAILSISELLKLLTDKDFELLVDLVYSTSGWRRIGAVGGPQKTVDLELMLPSTGERAFVQTKSQTTQGELDDYENRLEGREESRMFFVYHSSTQQLVTNKSQTVLVGPDELSELVFSAGLFDWLVEKVG